MTELSNINPRNSYWTKEQDDLLRSFIKDGLTRSEIAKELNVSRSSASGRISRLKLALPMDHPQANYSMTKFKRNAFTKRDKTQRLGNRISGRSTKQAKAPAPVGTPPPSIILKEKIEKPTSIVHEDHLKQNMCRYPLWGFAEKPTGFFCGSPVGAPGSRQPKSFCAYHHAICFTEIQRRIT